jgi:hypothetical protein
MKKKCSKKKNSFHLAYLRGQTKLKKLAKKIKLQDRRKLQLCPWQP